MAIASPAVACGTLMVLAGGSFLPHLAAVITFPFAVVGLGALLVHRR